MTTLALVIKIKHSWLFLRFWLYCWPFSYFLDFFGSFRLVNSRCFALLEFEPKLFYSGVFYQVALSLSNSRINKLITPKAVLIYFLSIKIGLKSGLGLDVNGFFYKLFKTIKFVAALFYLGSNWRSKIFLEISNHNFFLETLLISNFNKIDYRYLRWAAQSYTHLS